MSKNRFYITKSTGNLAEFDEDKLRTSLNHSGATPEVIDQIITKVKGDLYHEMSTSEIFEIAFDLLMKHNHYTASRYKLKKAIMELGPSGFPFEKFVAEVLTKEGYATELNQIVEGECVSHEVDIIAVQGSQEYLVECKFHSEKNRFCNVKDPLYIHSRYMDIKEKVADEHPERASKLHVWMITNTRFTQDASQYARCSGIRITSWNYPDNNSLKYLIEKHHLHPITSLTSISKVEKEQLLQMGVVLCSQLCDQKGVLGKIGISDHRINRIIKESHSICQLKPVL